MRPGSIEWMKAFGAATLFYLAGLWIVPLEWRLLAFAIIALALVLLRFYSSGSGNLLQTLKDRVDQIAEGNLESSRTVTDREEVLRNFSVSLEVLNSRLRQIVDKMKNVVESVGQTSEQVVDLSRSLLKSGRNQSEAAETASNAITEINGAIIRIAEAAESLNALGITASSAALQLAASIEEVTRNAQQVAVFARDTKASMEKMVEGMNQMDESSEMLLIASSDTDIAMQNMHDRIREVTQRATESDELAERASNAAEIGGRTVQELVQGMEKVAQAFESASKSISSLAQRSEHIGEILNVITQVADQTNLLSLNAAILSAQAGVHGKGFAVVADEIRKLSNRTAVSVQEIEQLISRVRIEMKEAVDAMEAGKVRLAEGLKASSKASSALSEISASTALARERVAAITQASQQQIHAEADVDRAADVIKQRMEQMIRIIREQTRAGNEVYLKAERTLDLLRNVEKGMEEQNHGTREVSTIVENLSGIIQDIHRATSEQSVRSSQVVQSVDSLKIAVHSSTATIRTLNTSALSLDQESFILKHELSRFRLPEPKSGGSLNLAVTTGISSLDPAYARYVYWVDWVYNFYEGLVEYGEGTDIHPLLAEKWEVSDDGLVYTFKLKKGVHFHNGKELTAADVKDSFERVLHPAANTPGTWVFETVAGAEEFVSGSALHVEGLIAVDPFTFQIRLRQPIPFFLGMLAQGYAYVIPSELARQYSPIQEVCGTGPFRLDRLIPDHQIEMSRFSDYHQPPFPYLDRVSVKLGVSESEIASSLRQGSIHLSTELQKRYLEDFMARPEWRPRLQTNVQLYTSLLSLNCKMAPLSDVRVRQAIACAIDRERIVREAVGTARAVVARTLIPPGLQGYDPSAVGYIYDPARSRSLLKQANVPEGTRIEMLQPESGTNLDVVQVLQENLKDVGIDVQVQYLAADVLQPAIETGKVPIRLTKWVADYPDPDNFLYVPFHSRHPAIQTGFRDPEFDRAVEEARLIADIRERIHLYRKAERIWMEQVPCVPMFHNQALILHQENVLGAIPHFTLPILRLKKISLS